jgi:hypothetical protein
MDPGMRRWPAAAGFSQFTSFSDRSRALLEGNWQSCRESDGQYAERIYDARFPGIGPFELHMGPYHEFALFRGVVDGHRDHNSTANLLRPFNVEVVNGARLGRSAARVSSYERKTARSLNKAHFS